MKPELVEKANTLLEEIKELKKYKGLLKTSHKDAVHFEIVQHYGDCKYYEKTQIERKHNNRFMALTDQIISELELQLKNL